MDLELRNIEEIDMECDFDHPPFLADVYLDERMIGKFEFDYGYDIENAACSFYIMGAEQGAARSLEDSFAKLRPVLIELDFIKPMLVEPNLTDWMKTLGLQAVLRNRTLNFLDRVEEIQDNGIVFGNIKDDFLLMDTGINISEKCASEDGRKQVMENLMHIRSVLDKGPDASSVAILNMNIPGDMLVSAGFARQYFSADQRRDHQLRKKNPDRELSVKIAPQIKIDRRLRRRL